MLNVLSLFSGIGAFEKALENLGIEHNVLAYCEIDKYASKAYSIIHNIPEEKNLRDVTKVDILDIDERVDLITYGFSCQDISNAGKQKGFTDENGERTRSGLFFEALRIIDDYRPKFAIAENVKALVSKKFTEEFKTVLESLDEIGYNNYYAVLNAKDYGIPQNRERVFIISIRKDIDKGFEFPDPIPLELKLKDLLEDEVDEKYYIDSQRVETLIDNARNNEYCNKNKNYDPKEGLSSYPLRSQEFVRTGFTEECNTLAARDYKDPKCVCVKEATKKGYTEVYPGDTVNLNYPNSKTRRGRVGKNGVSNALTCTDVQAVVVPSNEDDIEAFLNE